MQGGRQAGVVVVPVEDVEGRRLFAEQVVVDPVVPHQVVGAHPGEHLGHVAAVQHAVLVGAALAGFQRLLVGEQRGRAFHLAVEQADQIGRAGDLAQLPACLQVALQRGHGQAAGAGAHQVDAAAAADRAARLDGLVDGLHIGGKPPFAMSRVRVAPADDEQLDVVLQCVLHEAFFRRQIEDVELVDLRWHHQQWLGVQVLAQRLVLDQLQHLVAEHHCTGRGGQVAADFEGRLVHLAGHAAVVSQVVEQMARALDQAHAAGIEQLLHRQRIGQAVRWRQRIGEQRQQEARAGAVILIQVAFVDPGLQLLLPGQVSLQGAPVDWVEPPGRVLEACVLRVGLQLRIAEQHLAHLLAEGRQVTRAVQRLAHTLQGEQAHGGQQVLATRADDGVLRIHEVGLGFGATRLGLFSHVQLSVKGPSLSGCSKACTRMRDGALQSAAKAAASPVLALFVNDRGCPCTITMR
ncbi:hypothetical protein D9M71_341650 [compost metagenome]